MSSQLDYVSKRTWLTFFIASFHWVWSVLLLSAANLMEICVNTTLVRLPDPTVGLLVLGLAPALKWPDCDGCGE
jgi:hypothetical protein